VLRLFTSMFLLASVSFPQQSATHEGALDFCLIESHQLIPHSISLDHSKTVSDGLQGGHSLGSTLGAELKRRVDRRADFHSLHVSQFRMAGVKFPRLAPGSIGNNELDRHRLSLHQFVIQLNGVVGGVKEKRPVMRCKQIAQVESFFRFAPYPHFAVHQGSEREQTRIAASRQFSMVNDQTNPGV